MICLSKEECEKPTSKLFDELPDRRSFGCPINNNIQTALKINIGA